ncbi:rho guanine nucleotide exchange factor 12 isoform X3 [Nelusetta ayraudi]|uniref:rho guanine nucleotide exchange factor 12 isoform X3 n=1 Tax=Nelusetta ayraudi TaxID=303726 RepID=UPI003F706ED0
MSGPQSTLTDRTPNILNKNKDPVDRKSKHEKSSMSLKNEFDPTGLVQRCVIIQRDENGFGLTVSGDNPVFVQLVKEDGAAMRAGVQTGDRIIKVNGTLVTHSNHIEVVKLIKSGSYVALTVLGRPPGFPQIPLVEDEEDSDVEKREEEEKEEGAEVSSSSSPMTRPASERCPLETAAALLPDGVEDKTMHKFDALQKMLTREPQDLEEGAVGSSNSQTEEGESRPPPREPTPSSDDGTSTNNNPMHSSSSLPESPDKRETPSQSGNCCPAPDTEEAADTIIGAEDDYFDCQQEQINGECSSFQSIDLLKSRPAHLAVFIHHVVSQFDPAPLLCYLYADMHKQTNSKESRRFFIEFHSLFLDRTANLKVPLPELVSAELEKRRLDLIPEELCKQHTQVLQDSLLPDLHRNLEDFRQKRSMGLTLAEDELSKLDSEQGKEALEKECCCAEHILPKVEDILLSSQPTEEEKCQTMQYVISTYMKHLGVKVKEPRGLEHKRPRINFLPKIKKSIKPEKEGEEKVKKPRFPNILGPPRRLSRVDSTSVGKAVELNKQRSPKQLSQPTFAIPEQSDSSVPSSGRTRGNLMSESSDTSNQSVCSTASPTTSSTTGPPSDTSGHDSDCNLSPFCLPPRAGEGPPAVEPQDGVCLPAGTQFDFNPSNLEQLQEEDHDTFSRMEVQCAMTSSDVQSEDDQGGEMESQEDPQNWQSLVSHDVLASLTPQEIKRQEVINELFYTERSHLRKLKVLDAVFYQRMNRDGILPPEDIKHIFVNLEEIIQLHVSMTEQMTAIRKRSETSVIGQIADDLLAWFSGEEEEKIKTALGTFCSNQPSTLELIKRRRKKDQKFCLFMQEAERDRLCRRLQLKDIIPMEVQRFTKYPLLLENMAKYTEDEEEREKVKRAEECCKKILNHVNQAVKEAENKQRLQEYQRRLDISSLKQGDHPMILELKNLDLTKRRMVHEGPLLWKINKDKRIELYTLLLEDILVLLQKQDERLVLKFHGKNPTAAADTKNIFSPVIKLNTVLVRPVATNNKSFFVLSMSENGAQIYELMAQKVSDQRKWQCLISQCAEAMKAKPHGNDAPQVQPDPERDAIEIIKDEMPNTSKHPALTESTSSPDKDTALSPDIQASPSSNPFDSMKSEDEEEELTAAVDSQEEEGPAAVDSQEEEGPATVDSQEEEGPATVDSQEEEGPAAVDSQEEPEEQEDNEEVDEAELEAFLDGQLADGPSFLHDESGLTGDNQELSASFTTPPSKSEEALRTLATLKQVIFNHMLSREVHVEADNSRHSGASEGQQGGAEEPSASCLLADSQRENTPPQVGQTEASDTAERNGGFVLLDFVGAGLEESSTDDDGGVGGDVGIDMRKLLSSSSQAGGDCGGVGGPDLSRQLMTHLRLLQADLQHLKEVELKYNELRREQGDPAAVAADVSDSNGSLSLSEQTAD